MNFLTQILKRSSAFSDAAQDVQRKQTPLLIAGPAQVHKAHLCVSLCQFLNKKPIVVAADEAQAAVLRSDMAFFSGEEILQFPQKDAVLYNVDGASHDYTNARIETLLRILSGNYGGVVTTVEALCQMTTPPELLDKSSLLVKVGEELPMEVLLRHLVSCGYARCDVVEGAGQFAQRGGIVDFFSPQDSAPMRVELFGDEVDLIGHFDTDTQRRTENCASALISPAIEMVMTPGDTLRLRELLEKLLQKYAPPPGGRPHKLPENAEAVATYLRADLERLEQNGSLQNIEKYAALLYGDCPTLLDYLDENILFISEEGRVKERLQNFLWQTGEDVALHLEKGILCPELTKLSLDEGELLNRMERLPVIMLDTLMPSRTLLPPKDILNLTAKQLPSAVHGMDVLIEDLQHYQTIGYEVVLLTDTLRKAENLKRLLEESGLRPVLQADDTPTTAPLKIALGSLSASMEYPSIKFALICDTLGQVKDRPARKRHTAGEKIQSFADLSPGDLVVHANHGIGQYMGITPLTVQDVTKDYIKIKYAGEDILYVPCHQLDLISKYISASDKGHTKLNKMGGDAWAKTKQRVRAAAKDMAKELIALYARRQKVQGYAFPPDCDWQKEFEERFEYEETDDQLRCVAEIKEDMERQTPMDRLLCGDVGFGKTEVALRAAFKCVTEGKQAAILVPTTILAWQHFETIKKRIYPYPVKVEILSRFRTPKQQQEILRMLARGEVDIVVGTHRLVQKDIRFHDLGLLVVDEEQRFGVAHKEKLKELFCNVDVLTLTATPIPRTLNMALTGIRDMSVIEEAPRDRQAVQTYVMEHDDSILADAIKRELRRGGQVFYLYNRTETIERTAARLKKLVPEAAIAVAHGKMEERELSKIWEEVVTGAINVLVCTTIIETGVDVPNANTLIIEDADRLGLSQLHQIRGRVGRSARRAYAYFTYRKGKVLSEDAVKRLSTIREFTEFGSGFKIAMRDLEIRGAGNVLGSEQHGQMEAVGYDMYLKLLEEAVLEERGEAPLKKTECLIDMFVDTHIPERYIPAAMVRIEIYKKIAVIATEADKDDLLDELSDRFGDLPKAVMNLIAISQIRNMASQIGISEISQKEGCVTFAVGELPFPQIAKIIPLFPKKMLYNAGNAPYLSLKIPKNASVLPAVTECLQIIHGVLLDKKDSGVI